jgi:hypothetical protein
MKVQTILISSSIILAAAAIAIAVKKKMDYKKQTVTKTTNP